MIQSVFPPLVRQDFNGGDGAEPGRVVNVHRLGRIGVKRFRNVRSTMFFPVFNRAHVDSSSDGKCDVPI